MRLRTALLAVFTLLALSSMPAVAGAHHQDTGIDSDRDGLQNRDDPCPYHPVPAREACNGFEDLDGDQYPKFQDPCDNNANNSSCDSDGDGEPNQYDPCPNGPSGHMLGSDTKLARQDRSCPPQGQKSVPKPVTDISTGFGKPARKRTGLSLGVGLTRGQTLGSILRSGLELRIRCNRRCTAYGVAFVGRTAGFAARTQRRLGKRRSRGVKLRLSRKSKRALRRKKRLRMQVYMAGVTSDGRFDSDIPLSRANVSITSSGVKVAAVEPGRVSDSASALGRLDLLQAGAWWIGAARALGGPGCSLDVNDLYALTVQPTDVRYAAAGANPCAVARVWADIGKQLGFGAFRVQTGPNYRVVVQLIPQSDGPDHCIQWVNVQGKWNFWAYKDSAGRTC